MTVAEIKKLTMFQTNNDESDVALFEPHLNVYINEGYEKLVWAWAEKHLGDEGYPRLSQAMDEPKVPERAHKAIADYASWMILRTGNAARQSRGAQFLRDFGEAEYLLRCDGGIAGKDLKHFRNIPD